jgi:hypothetical protein
MSSICAKLNGSCTFGVIGTWYHIFENLVRYLTNLREAWVWKVSKFKLKWQSKIVGALQKL